MTPVVLALVLGATLALAAGDAVAGPTTVRCDPVATDDLVVDGLLDDWTTKVVARLGAASDGSLEVRCAWDGAALALVVTVKDDRVVRVPGKGDQDRVDVAVQAEAGADGSARASVWPGTKVAPSKVTVSKRVSAAESLQPKGFSVEVRIPAAAITGLSASTPALAATITFHDADQATGGDTTELVLELAIELTDRRDLLEDFLRTVKLRKSDVKVDALAELDPDRKGKERIVAGGTVIGVLTDQFAFVSLPAATAADVRKVELVELGPRGLRIVVATVRQSGNGGSRDLLMLWTVWSGQLQPLGQIELRKQLGTSVLDSRWRVVKAKPGKAGRGKPAFELWVEPRPAVGFTAETWNEEPASDADPILMPWDPARAGIAYALSGAELTRRDLPARQAKPKPKRR